MPAVFVDRDGTLNREVGYLRRVADLRLVPGTAGAVRALTDAGFAVVVVTNQSGIARGLITPAVLAAIHQTLRDRLARAGARLAGIYVCPHHPTAGTPPLRRRCRCRKPAPGMIVRAVRELGLDLARSYLHRRRRGRPRARGDDPHPRRVGADGARSRDGGRPRPAAAGRPRRRELSCGGRVDYR